MFQTDQAGPNMFYKMEEHPARVADVFPPFSSSIKALHLNILFDLQPCCLLVVLSTFSVFHPKNIFILYQDLDGSNILQQSKCSSSSPSSSLSLRPPSLRPAQSTPGT